MHRVLPALLWASLSLSASIALAATAEERGLAIATEADRRDQGFRDSIVDLEMVLANRHGEESRRRLRVSTLEGVSDGDKSLAVFRAPADVKDTALLTFSRKIGDDDQWLYLPAVARVKRISSANKSGSFAGSEFSYEDLAPQEVERYSYKFLRDETYEGQPCFIIERHAIGAYSGYSREQVWLDQVNYRPLKVEYYDRKQSLLKTLIWNGYKLYAERYWRADEMLMKNHQNGKSTLLRWSGYRFGVGLADGDFTERRLSTARGG